MKKLFLHAGLFLLFFFLFLPIAKAQIADTNYLHEDECLENNNLKMCFDKTWGGVMSGLYNKRIEPGQNLIWPTAGGSFQIDFRSADAINACPEKIIGWGKVWNPTEAGCEGCFKEKNDGFLNVPSVATFTRLSASEILVENRPRNYFHDNQNDCQINMPYTENGLAAEDIYMKKTVTLYADYIKIVYDFEHKGGHVHYADRNNFYRHELPTVYTSGQNRLWKIFHQAKTGAVSDESFLSGTRQAWLDFYNSWFSIHQAKGKNNRFTVVANTSLVDNRDGHGVQRSFLPETGTFQNQFDFSYYFAIMPNMKFRTTFYVLPYVWGEKMVDARSVSDFIAAVQKTDVVGWARHFPESSSWCQKIVGWASNANFSLDVASVKIFDNDVLIGDVPANQYWDPTVGNHGFVFNYDFGPGNHDVRVLALDPNTQNHAELLSKTDAPLTFSCSPAQNKNTNLYEMINKYLSSSSYEDWDNSGKVNALDFSMLFSAFSQSSAPTSAKPTSSVLIGRDMQVVAGPSAPQAACEKAFGAKKGGKAYVSSCDLDKNGIINVLDLSKMK